MLGSQGHSQGKSAHDLELSAHALAKRLPALLVEASRVAQTVAHGIHGRRRAGPGETFWQFRHYEPGDQPQLIDWRQSGKSDQVFVRELEWEAAQSVWLWSDVSASMGWTSSDSHDSKRKRAELLALARSLGLECLVEVHDEQELERALAADAQVIGINNRDLRTFEVDLAVSGRLRPLIPEDRVVVAESGIHTRADVERLQALGVNAVLIGEALVTAEDPAAKVRELLGA